LERERLDHDEEWIAALRDLGEAERAAASEVRGTWAAVERALERPTVASRLPLGWAAAWRVGHDLGRPALAGSLVAAVAGLGVGAWLALATGRAPVTADTAGLFATSNLDAAASGGFESDFLDPAAADPSADAGVPAATAGDTTTDEATP